MNYSIKYFKIVHLFIGYLKIFDKDFLIQEYILVIYFVAIFKFLEKLLVIRQNKVIVMAFYHFEESI